MRGTLLRIAHAKTKPTELRRLIMADETTETTTADTTTAVTPSEPSGVLDLRPPKESVRAELCRLGLEFSSADGTAESWRDYQRGVLATFDDTGTSVTLTDVKTNLGRTLTLDELKAVTRIDTMTAAD